MVLEVQYFNMAIKPISLPSRSLPNLQASAAGGRPFRVSRMTPARLFPKQQEPEAVQEVSQAGIPGVDPIDPIIAPSRILPGDTDASFDPSQAMAEGQTNVGGFPITANFAEAGTQFGKGHYGKGAFSLAKGILGFTPQMMAYNVLKSTVLDPVKEGIKGLLSSDPANLGSAVPSGTGISGLSGPMGLAHAEAGNLADIGVNPDVGFDGGNMGMGDDGMSSLGEGFE